MHAPSRNRNSGLGKHQSRAGTVTDQRPGSACSRRAVQQWEPYALVMGHESMSRCSS